VNDIVTGALAALPDTLPANATALGPDNAGVGEASLTVFYQAARFTADSAHAFACNVASKNTGRVYAAPTW